ncbi:efflux RND transporter periplasmic adaptor subunit [Nitrincola sp. MINF-07-Sa-05]|uniref:efflux RND transporter periplasmic adaptor subunit n=1 Tax=Nitrincola salilacus TaxID=3400273 RepID=UPI0039182AA2
MKGVLSALMLGLSCALVSTGDASAQDAEPVGLQRFTAGQEVMRAQLSPQRFTTLAAGLSARINTLSVHEGERFDEGQVLVEFDCGQQTAQLNKANAQLSAAQNQHQGNQHLAQLNAIGQVELRSSEIEIAKARADLAYLQEIRKHCIIHAPFSGRVGEVQVRALQFIQAGQPLLELIDDSTLELEFRVPSRWLSWLQPEYQFEVHIDETERTYPVRLLRTAARVDPISQTIRAIAVIDGHYSELIAGMSGRILLNPPQ